MVIMLRMLRSLLVSTIFCVGVDTYSLQQQVPEVAFCQQIQSENFLGRLKGYNASYPNYEQDFDVNRVHVHGVIRFKEVVVFEIPESELQAELQDICPDPPGCFFDLQNFIYAFNSWGRARDFAVVYPTCERKGLDYRAFGVLRKQIEEIITVPISQISGDVAYGHVANDHHSQVRAAKRYSYNEKGWFGFATFNGCWAGGGCKDIEIAVTKRSFPFVDESSVTALWGGLFKFEVALENGHCNGDDKFLHARIIAALLNLLDGKLRRFTFPGREGHSHPIHDWIKKGMEKHTLFQARDRDCGITSAEWIILSGFGDKPVLSICRQVYAPSKECIGTSWNYTPESPITLLEATLLKAMVYTYESEECTLQKPSTFSGSVSCEKPCPTEYFAQLSEEMLCSVSQHRADLGLVVVEVDNSITQDHFSKLESCAIDKNQRCMSTPSVSVGETVGIIVGVVSTLIACLSLSLAVYQHRKHSMTSSRRAVAKTSTERRITNKALSESVSLS